MINRTFVSRHTEILLKLYLSLVRPKVEYCILRFTGDLILKNIDMFEKVQKRATRLMITEKWLTYEERVKSWVSQHWRREDCLET